MIKRSLLLPVMFGLIPSAAHANELNSADTAWILTSAGLVLFMTLPGLALFYGGLVRTKNVLGTMMHSFVAISIIGVLWTVCGYALAFGGNILGGFLVGSALSHPGLRPVPAA